RGEVLTFDRDGRPLGVLCPAGTVGRPAGLAVDAAAGEVYIADVTGHHVVVTDAQGRVRRTIGRHGAGPGEFNFPTHVAIGGGGRLLVADSMNFRVQLLATDGRFIREIGRAGDAPGQFANPKGVAMDVGGNLIAVEGLHDAIEFFNDGGQLLLSLGRPGQDAGEFWLPAGLAFDPAEGLLFVADSYNRRVQVFRMLGGASTGVSTAAPR
ncbi:MAG: 6-bladed beta-propeller, partial [bacterium]|nr:6-bladed beta-propeller [bacterium]